MAVNLNKAPSVIPKRRVIKLAGQAVGESETFEKEIEAQSLSDVRYLLRAITLEEVDRAIKVGNEPTRFIVDAREGARTVDQALYKTETFFGEALDMVMVRALEREIMHILRREIEKILRLSSGPRAERRIKLSVADRKGLQALMARYNWVWLYSAAPGERMRKVSPYRIGAFPAGALLLFKPTSNYASFANFLSARMQAGLSGKDFWRRGKTGGRGAILRGVDKVRRNRLLRNFTITVEQTQNYALPGERYRPRGEETTFSVAIRARRRRRAGYRR